MLSVQSILHIQENLVFLVLSDELLFNGVL